MHTPSVVKYSVDTQVDVFDTQAFTEAQIQNTREYAHTSNLGGHSRTHFQRDCMFANRHPFSPVDAFDHRTTPTSAIVFEAAILVTFHRFPRL